MKFCVGCSGGATESENSRCQPQNRTRAISCPRARRCWSRHATFPHRLPHKVSSSTSVVVSFLFSRRSPRSTTVTFLIFFLHVVVVFSSYIKRPPPRHIQRVTFLIFSRHVVVFLIKKTSPALVQRVIYSFSSRPSSFLHEFRPPPPRAPRSKNFPFSSFSFFSFTSASSRTCFS